MKAARDNFCPADGCTSSFRTMDGLHDHIDTRHPGETIESLRGDSNVVSGTFCPVEGCQETFDSVEGVQGHVAGKAPHCDSHREIRDSDFHSGEFYDILVNGR